MHDFTRYVALGDSFTEGVGDPDPRHPNGLRGWADRVAEQLAARSADFADLLWTKDFLVPWIGRRVRGTSSGDGISAKRPTLQPLR
jgi:lysophospholipase L1-like esterase